MTVGPFRARAAIVGAVNGNGAVHEQEVPKTNHAEAMVLQLRAYLL